MCNNIIMAYSVPGQLFIANRSLPDDIISISHEQHSFEQSLIAVGIANIT